MPEPFTLPPLSDLLARVGFRVCSATRADCVCPGRSRMTIAFHDDVAYCHRCHRSWRRQSLLRELGLLATDPKSADRRRAEARETARLQAIGERLRQAEKRVLGRAKENLQSLLAIWRNAGDRLAALHAGAPEHFPGETEFAWDALQFVADHQARASAAYLVAAFAAERDRAVFALHPDQRMPMVERLLNDGWLQTDRGWMELSL